MCYKRIIYLFLASLFVLSQNLYSKTFAQEEDVIDSEELEIDDSTLKERKNKKNKKNKNKNKKKALVLSSDEDGEEDDEDIIMYLDEQ